MAKPNNSSELGLLLRQLLKERSLSMRNFSELTGIDTATISRIINNKRKATPQHLEKFAECLGIPLIKLFEAAGYPLEQNTGELDSDLHVSIGAIQSIFKDSNINDENFSIERVKQKLKSYEAYAETEEGKNTITNGFKQKIQEVGSVGPFINKLKDFHTRFISRKGSIFELALIGSSLLYFIIPVDVIPDYLLPIGYLDDAIAVQLITNALLKP
ncbi:helix-turn-helix domain-containing protein [Rummeliibacillus sp. G93]|uniref:helix-turn-helix domain-containing protein n=1 Tax=Rummeliibacillus TaxID=648802 RepID=UPI00123A7D00|nr:MULTISPECIES: helix-turn-helix domain-containing protein [unclassified Rummeliibacillus]UQW97045.1 helix-turn-helix domain-containing protein [Rummeliibacillus sp. G93]